MMTHHQEEGNPKQGKGPLWPTLLVMYAVCITVVATALFFKGIEGLVWVTPISQEPKDTAVAHKQLEEQKAQHDVELSSLREQLDKVNNELDLVSAQLKKVNNYLDSEREKPSQEETKLLNALYTTLRDYQTWTAGRLGLKSYIFRDLPYGPEMMVIPARSLEMDSYFEEEFEPGSVAPPPKRNMAKPLAVGVTPLTHAAWARCEKDGACPRREDAAETNSSTGYYTWLSSNELSAYTRWLNREIKRRTGKPGKYRLMTRDEKETLTDIAVLFKIDDGLALSSISWLAEERMDRLVRDLP
jgi:formylglycine-generating enzyme required for sulfatase activity